MYRVFQKTGPRPQNCILPEQLKKVGKIYLGTVIIQFSTEGANLLLVAQGRPLIGDRVAYRAQGAQVL